MDPERLLIYIAQVHTPSGVLQPGWLLTEGKTIRLIEAGEPPELEAGRVARRIDARGQALLPGFIDLHVHGAMGHDTMDAAGRPAGDVPLLRPPWCDGFPGYHLDRLSRGCPGGLANRNANDRVSAAGGDVAWRSPGRAVPQPRQVRGAGCSPHPPRRPARSA